MLVNEPYSILQRQSGVLSDRVGVESVIEVRHDEYIIKESFGSFSGMEMSLLYIDRQMPNLTSPPAPLIISLILDT